MTDTIKQRLAEFARWVLTDGSWQGCDIDGGDAQDKAVELGLIVKVPFDPATHDGVGAEYCEPGDDWYVFSAALKEDGHD